MREGLNMQGDKLSLYLAGPYIRPSECCYLSTVYSCVAEGK